MYNNQQDPSSSSPQSGSFAQGSAHQQPGGFPPAGGQRPFTTNPASQAPGQTVNFNTPGPQSWAGVPNQGETAMWPGTTGSVNGTNWTPTPPDQDATAMWPGAAGSVNGTNWTPTPDQGATAMWPQNASGAGNSGPASWAGTGALNQASQAGTSNWANNFQQGRPATGSLNRTGSLVGTRRGLAPTRRSGGWLKRKDMQLALICGVVILVLIGSFGAFAIIGAKNQGSNPIVQNDTPVPTVTTGTTATVTASPTATPSATATVTATATPVTGGNTYVPPAGGNTPVVVPTTPATAAPTPTVAPTATPTPAPTATAAPTATPTTAPTATATPTYPPAPSNPYGYDFNPTGGSLIYTAPADFCTHFTCVADFNAPDATGYIVACNKGGYYSHRGASGCADPAMYGGILSPLYKHP